MSTYDYKVALSVLTEAEKNRMVAIYLNSEAVNNTSLVDWQQAAAAFGSASVDSMKICARNSIKKIEKAMASGSGTAPATPSSAKAKGGKKRKAADEAGDDAKEAPKSKRGRKGKKAASEKLEAADEDAAGGEDAIKAEGEEDA